MSETKITAEQKKLSIDLWIIVIATLAVLGLYIVFQSPIDAISRNTVLWDITYGNRMGVL